jgi:hypothetical protein
LGVALLDYDRDGWPILVANDTQQQALPQPSPGDFPEAALEAGMRSAAMGRLEPAWA